MIMAPLSSVQLILGQCTYSKVQHSQTAAFDAFSR